MEVSLYLKFYKKCGIIKEQGTGQKIEKGSEHL